MTARFILFAHLAISTGRTKSTSRRRKEFTVSQASLLAVTMEVNPKIATVVCVPMDVNAFILNEKVCDKGLVRVAPITQPDYLGLRPDPAEIQHDILPHVDVHRTQPAS